MAGLLVRELGRIPERGDRALVPLPVEVPEDDDEAPVQEHVVLRVERMDGLRVDRISIRRLLPDDGDASPGEAAAARGPRSDGEVAR